MPIVITASSVYIRTVYSPRLNRQVTLYSSLEYDHYVAVEQDPTIDAFCEQPVRVSVVIDGKRISSVLDMWLLRKNGYEEYREVKPLALVDTQKNAMQIRADTLWCQTQGTPFQLITEHNIGLNPQALENWKQILPYLTNTAWVTHKGLDSAMEHYLQNIKSTTLGELEQQFSAPSSEVYRAAFLLLHRGMAVANLSAAPLTRRTILEWRVEGG